MVGEILTQWWSPQQISRHLRRQFPNDQTMWLCAESIYQAVYQTNSPFMRPTPLAPHRRSPLRTSRDHRRAHQHQQRRRPRFQQPMLTIGRHPFAPLDRSEVGHWEGDLITGDNQLSAIGTLVERHTRMLRLLHLTRGDADSVHTALVTDEQSATPHAAVDHLRPGHRDGTPPRHHRKARRTGLLLQLTLTMATRHQREHQRIAARLLPPKESTSPPAHPTTSPPPRTTSITAPEQCSRTVASRTYAPHS